MSKEQAHSELPWTVSGIRGPFPKDKCLAILCGPEQRANIFVSYSDRTDELHRASHADAAFIVRACNQFYENKALISELVEALEFYAADDVKHPNEGPWGIDSHDFGNVARAALAKARRQDQ